MLLLTVYHQRCLLSLKTVIWCIGLIVVITCVSHLTLLSTVSLHHSLLHFQHFHQSLLPFTGTDYYVCDFKGHCVAVFGQDGQFKYRIGNEKITSFPNGIDISDAGDILIGDSHGNRFHVACFSRDGILQSEYECPHVKVRILFLCK